MQAIFIYITNPSKEVAKQVCRHLLAQKLIACGNIFPIESLYTWQGQLEEAEEFVLIAKTLPDKYEAVCRAVVQVHPYTVPCITQLPADPNPAYLEWMRGEIL